MVPTGVVRERPELTVAPGFMVEAVVIEPWAAHPTDSSGYYRRDLEHHELYGSVTATVQGFERYVDEWILGTADQAALMRKLGEPRTATLALRPPWW
jgi:glutaconate CoA-transferase subunit A